MSAITQHINDLIRPHAVQLAERVIQANGGLVVLMTRDTGACDTVSTPLDHLGWDGVSNVWLMSRGACEAYAQLMEQRFAWDPVTPRFLRSRREGRVLVVDCSVGSSWLLNVTDEGMFIEPGSTDAELHGSTAPGGDA